MIWYNTIKESIGANWVSHRHRLILNTTFHDGVHEMLEDSGLANNNHSPEKSGNLTGPDVAVARAFYDAFSRHDGESMAQMYDRDARFFDPVFRELDRESVQDMWRMLCRRSKDLRIEYQIVSTDPEGTIKGTMEGYVTVRWDAYYTFKKTGRKVHNIVTSRLLIKNGKIFSQDDDFDLYRWTRQAFGILGVIVGWTPMFHNKVHAFAISGLKEFRSQKTRDAK